MGILIYYVYKRFFTGVVYSRSFAVTLVGMCVLTCMVTLAISTNVVISLGMVGALSIVRYRTAVKDPLDLLYLFWAITTGITAGAGMYALVRLTAVVIVVMIAGFASHQDKGGYYVPAFCRMPDRSTLRWHLPGDLPLKPSLSFIKYASLLFRGTSPRQLPAC